MRVQITLPPGAELPTNAHPTDTGYDVLAVGEPKIVGEEYVAGLWRRIDYLEYTTEIRVTCEDDQIQLVPISEGRKAWTHNGGKIGYLQVFSRSSISKTNLVLANSVAVIDNAYRGPILLRFKYLWQPEDTFYELRNGSVTSYGVPNLRRIYHAGDKIAQLVAAWKESIEWAPVDQLSDTARGHGGFGSSDRFPDIHTDIAIKGGTPSV